MVERDVSYKTIEPLLKPDTVAILGASSNKNKLGYRQVKALLDGGFQGDIYPINPSTEYIEHLPCYSSLAEVPKQVDLVIFCVGADKVEGCLEECATNKVKAVVLFASGYSETGSEGAAKQRRLENIAKENGIRMIGPNCVGLVNTRNGLVSTFSPGLTALPLSDKREVGFITQSGAFGVLTYIAAAQSGLTFNYFVSVGNEADIQFSDLVEYMIHDDDTSVISGYLEGEKEPKRLQKLAEKALQKNKPIIIMKSGRSSAGSRAAVSHTGSLAGSDRIYDDFFRQTGIIRADDYEDIISFSKLHLSGKIPSGRNTVIITTSGGRGINESDRCEAYGLNVMSLNEKTQAAVKRCIPSFGSASNPIDLTAEAAVTNPELFIEPLKVLVEDPEVDNIIFTEFPSHWDAETAYLQEFIDICKNTDKFIFVTTFPLDSFKYPAATEELNKNKIPMIPGDLNPIRSLVKLIDYGEKYRREINQTEVKKKSNRKHNDISHLLTPGATLSESEASTILENYGITAAKKAVAVSETEAVQHAKNIGYPIVMKVDSPDIPHKTEADAVKLNINSEEVADTYKRITENAKNYNPSAKLNGVSVQQMLPGGAEVICGVSNDPVFGPVIMFGLGGVFVEVFEDIAFRVAPIRKTDAMEMIKETKGYQVLQGTRGKPPVDIEAIAEVLLGISDLVTDYGEEIKELDINPLIVYENGAVAADGMIVVNEAKTESVIGG